jgi:hypothetical protein
MGAVIYLKTRLSGVVFDLMYLLGPSFRRDVDHSTIRLLPSSGKKKGASLHFEENSLLIVTKTRTKVCPVLL